MSTHIHTRLFAHPSILMLKLTGILRFLSFHIANICHTANLQIPRHIPVQLFTSFIEVSSHIEHSFYICIYWLLLLSLFLIVMHQLTKANPLYVNTDSDSESQWLS